MLMESPQEWLIVAPIIIIYLIAFIKPFKG